MKFLGHFTNLLVFSLATTFAFQLALPLQFLDEVNVDLSQDEPDYSRLPSIRPAIFHGFDVHPEGTYAARDVTPDNFLVDDEGQPRPNPNHVYLVPLTPNENVAAETPVILARIITDQSLDAYLQDNKTLRGYVHRPSIEFYSSYLNPTAAELTKQTGREVMILDHLDGRSGPLWLSMGTFGLLVFCCVAIAKETNLFGYATLAAILTFVGFAAWNLVDIGWLWMPTAAVGVTGLAMFTSLILYSLYRWTRSGESLARFEFDEKSQHDANLLFVGDDHIRLINGAGETKIRDQDVVGITWLQIIQSGTESSVNGYFVTQIAHDENGETKQTEIRTTYEMLSANYVESIDRLAAYRNRVAGLRAEVLKAQLKQNGSIEGETWSVDEHEIQFTKRDSKAIRIAREDFQDCRFIHEEFSIHHAQSDVPIRVESHTADLLILGRILKSLVTPESTQGFAQRPEGRVLARFTSLRYFPSRVQFPRWCYYLTGTLFMLFPLILVEWVSENDFGDLLGIRMTIWVCAAYLGCLVAMGQVRKLFARHMDLCENGLRFTTRTSQRFVTWEQFSDAKLSQMRLTSDDNIAFTIYKLDAKLDDGNGICFSWASNSACTGELTALEQFVDAIAEEKHVRAISSLTPHRTAG